MADKTVSMKELRDVLERFIKDIEGAEVIRLDAAKKEAGRMAKPDVKKALGSLKAASLAASEICQQPVLAVMLRRAAPGSRKTARGARKTGSRPQK